MFCHHQPTDLMASAIVDNATILVDRTSVSPLNNDADPYTVAVELIRAIIKRHRTNKDSLGEHKDTSDSTNGITDDSHRSRSPVGLTNDAQTIEDIEGILNELERNHRIITPKLTHDSSEIEADLVSSVDGVQIIPPPPAVEAPWSTQEVVIRPTHPQGYAPYDYHIDKVKTFENDLKAAVNNSKDAKAKYTTVEVLLLTWEAGIDDDIRKEVDEDTQNLTKLFEGLAYTITSFSIPRDPRTSLIRLQKKLLEFVGKYEDSEEDDVLFIVHYNGHGSIRNKASCWHPTKFAAWPSDPFDRNSEQNGPTIEYNDVRKIFDSVANQDILFILDCCFAGAASHSKGPGNTKELLAACGSADITYAKPSFTSRFVKCFREQIKTDPVFQVGWLFESMTSISQKPTPLHLNLNKSPWSICLSSLATTKPGGPAMATNENASGNLSPLSLLGAGSPSSAAESTKSLSIFSDDKDDFDENTPPTSTSDAIPPDSWTYQVLIAVKLKENVLPEMKGWHLEFPSSQVAALSSVKVRSMYLSKSTLVLVTMPIRCWVLLPDNPAYTFIDFVKTDDMLHPLPDPEPESPPKVIQSITRSDSDKSNKELEYVGYILDAMKEFYQKNKPEMTEKPGTIRNFASKIGLHSSRLESDPRYGYIRHVMQQFVIVRNEHGESRISYDLHFTEEKRLFEKCKKSVAYLVKEALQDADPKNGGLEDTVTAEIDQLEKEVLSLVEVGKGPKNCTVEPKPSVKTNTKQRSIVSHDPIPEDREVTNAQMQPRTDSGFGAGIPRTESSVSIRKQSRTDSMKHSIAKSDSRPILSFLGRKLSRESGRSNSPMQTPMQSPLNSPRVSAHLSYTGIPA